MKNILFFPNKLGQKLNGFKKSSLIIDNIIKNEHNKKKYWVELYDNQDLNLYNLYKVNREIKESKINIGGDHSLSIATVSQSLKLYPNMKLIWIDAHPDINTRESSQSESMHGMPLSFLTGLDNRKFLFDIPITKLKFENILYIGIRDIDEYEKYIIDKHNIQVIDSKTINNEPKKSLEKINNFIDGDPIHLSFDVDALDPKFIYSTGTPVNNGLNPSEIKYIIDNLLEKNIINMDIVELNLTLGNQAQINKSIHNFKYIFDNYLDFI